MMLRAIRDMALSLMHGVNCRATVVLVEKKYDANPVLFLFIL